MSDVILIDVNGNKVIVDKQEITKNLTIYGMEMNVISALRSAYFNKGGLNPITPESVRDAFNKRYF